MSVTPRTITAAQLTAAAATYYTAPANTKSIVKKLTFTNNDASAHTFTVYLVPSGGTASAANILIKDQAIAAGECAECYQAAGQVLQVGGTIQALADAASPVTLPGAIAEVV